MVSFWRQIFYSREFHTTNATVGDLSNTRILLLVNKIYVTENKSLLGIYAVMNQVTLRPKEIIHVFFYKGDLVTTFCWFWMSQTLLICSSGLNRLKNENGKNKRKTESRRRNKIFSLKLTWGEIAIKFSSNSKACSLANKRHDGMVER